MVGSSRRRVLAAGLSLAGVTAGCATLRDVSPYHATIDSVDGTWPMHGYDPGNSTFAPENRAPAGRLAQAWTSSLDEDLSTGPSVGDGAVFVRATEMLYALDGTSGDVRWQQRIGAGMFQTPVVDAGTVYVATRGGIGALEADTGAVLWGEEISERLFMRPVVAGDTVYAMDGGGTAAALSRDDGAVRWRTDTTNAGLPRPATTFVVGETELLQVGSGSLYALATGDGTVDWRKELPESEAPTLLVAGDTVVVGQRRSVYTFDVPTGTRRWQVHLDDQVESVCSDGASLYVTSVRDPEAPDTGGVVRCLDLTDGAERWTLEGGEEFGAPTLAGAGDTLYVLGQHRNRSRRRLLSIDTDSGTKQWSRTFDTSLDYDIAVVDGALFLSEHGSGVRAFSTPG